MAVAHHLIGTDSDVHDAADQHAQTHVFPSANGGNDQDVTAGGVVVCVFRLSPATPADTEWLCGKLDPSRTHKHPRPTQDEAIRPVQTIEL